MAEPADGEGDVPTEAELAQALPRTKMYWNRKKPESHGTLFLFVDSRPQRLG
jgi:hypothetical protein